MITRKNTKRGVESLSFEVSYDYKSIRKLSIFMYLLVFAYMYFCFKIVYNDRRTGTNC